MGGWVPQGLPGWHLPIIGLHVAGHDAKALRQGVATGRIEVRLPDPRVLALPDSAPQAGSADFTGLLAPGLIV